MTRKAAAPTKKTGATNASKPRRTARKTTRPGGSSASARRLGPPLLVYVVFAAVALGTWSLSQELRLLALWGVLLIGSLLLGSQRGATRISYRLFDIGRGLVFGLVLGLPLAILFPDALLATSRRLFGQANPAQILLGLVVIAPVVEGIYFRGFLQPAAGLALTAALYGLAALILFLPAALGFPAVLLALTVVMAALGLVYGAIAARYGLVASITCQAATAFALWIVPVLLRPMG